MSPWRGPLMEVPADDVKVKGLSPKVYLPAGLILLAGAVLLALGLDKEGWAVLAVVLPQLGIGYQAKAGTVEVPVNPRQPADADTPVV